jgi:uncharacterized protein
VTFHWDKLLNFTTGLGIPGADKGASAEYSLVLLRPDQLEAAYRSDWIVRKAIEIPAFDSTRMWRAWQAEQDQIEALEETEQRLNIKRKLERALIKARLYGGAAIVIGVDGNMEDELNPDAVKKGALKFLHVMPAYALRAGEMTRDVASPWYGEPGCSTGKSAGSTPFRILST